MTLTEDEPSEFKAELLDVIFYGEDIDAFLSRWIETSTNEEPDIQELRSFQAYCLGFQHGQEEGRGID